jgi:hypothetical protein
MILLNFVLLIVGFYALYTLSRVTGSGDEREDTQKRLAAAAAALERFAAATGRLPCPADGAGNTGLEQQASASTCTHGATGTLPWLTLGLAGDAGLDAWGRKISYRVYTGNKGSFTQPGGVNMVNCDTVEPSPGGTTPNVGSAGGLCNAGTDIYGRNTTPQQFVAGKGLTLDDFGTNYADVAYVLISHGATGAGAWTIAGTMLDLPTGDERNNTRETGPFTAKAFSPPDTAFNAATHFDDQLAYRRIGDLAARINLAARDWPEGAIFNAATMAAAVGSSAYGDTNRNTFNFMGNAYSSSGGSGGNFSFATSGGIEGIGVVGDGSNSLSATEFIRVDLAGPAARIGLALNDFGTFTVLQKYREQAQIRFYKFNSSTSSFDLVGAPIAKQACRSGSVLATFLMEPTVSGSTFDRVEMQPLLVEPNLFGLSSFFLISEFAACQAPSACGTTLSSSSNLCTNPSINVAFAPTTVDPGTPSVLSFAITNGTDNPLQGGISFTETLPVGLVVAPTPGTQTNCPAGGAFAAPGFSVTAAPSMGVITVTGLSIGNDVASCELRVNVASGTVGTYANIPANLGDTTNLINSVTPATLTVQ